MVAKPHNQEGARGRSGMPLARAQRLADRAESDGADHRSKAPLLLGVAALTVIGAGIYMAGFGPEPAARAPITVAAPIAETPTVQVEQTASVVPTLGQTATPTVASNNVSDVFDPALQKPVLTPCVRDVETRLQTLYRVDVDNAQWGVKRDSIRATVQAVLDCNDATFDLNGDFELASSEIADLQVTWDRLNAHLVLTIVDSAPRGSDQVVFANDSQPIEFIVH